MSYEYTDADLDHLSIGRSENGPVFIEVYNGSDVTTVYVESNDAPAVALAILTCAGIEPADHHLPKGLTAEGYRMLAVSALQQAEREDAQRAAREAEDAKVRALHAAMYGKGYLHDDEPVHENFRDVYRAAREFFTREHENGWQDKTAPPIGDLDCVASTDEIIAALEDKPEPRVLQHGDPEPDRGTRWRDKEGDLWERFDDGWHWTEKGNGKPDSYAHTWSLLQRRYFPMTEVTP